MHRGLLLSSLEHCSSPSVSCKSNLPFSRAAALDLTRTLRVTATVKATVGVVAEAMPPLPPSRILHSLGAFLVIRTKKWVEARDSAQCPTVSRSLIGDNQSLETNQTKHPAESRVVSWLVFCQFDTS